VTHIAERMGRYVQARRTVDSLEEVDEAYLSTDAVGRPGPMYVILDSTESSTRALFDPMREERLVITCVDTFRDAFRVQMVLREWIA